MSGRDEVPRLPQRPESRVGAANASADRGEPHWSVPDLSPVTRFNSAQASPDRLEAINQLLLLPAITGNESDFAP